MRTLLLVDSDSKNKEGRIKAALERVKADYGNLIYEIQYWDFSNLPWVNYDAQAKGIAFPYMRDVAKTIYQNHHLEFDNIIFCVDTTNWQDGELVIGGWNIGGKTGEYYAQIVRVMDSDEWLYKAFAMEIAHMWDDICWYELFIDLNKLTALDWDYDIIHGENPKYGSDVRGTPAEKWTRTGWYTNYDFSKIISEFSVYFNAALSKRKKSFDVFIEGLKVRISLYQRIIELLKQLRALSRPKASPILLSEITGYGEHTEHHH